MSNATPLKVYLLSRPSFIALPPELGVPRPDQLQGTDAEKLIETAGRTCYDSFGKGRDSASYATHILDVGHGSVLEHAQFGFFITGVSRGLTHELVRHRIGVAISQRSTRYVDEDGSPWIMHPLLVQYLDTTDDDSLGTDWDHAVENCQHVYTKIVERLERFCIDKGLDKLTARKQARGAARGILGNALETELVWSANVRALRHVIAMRAADAADAEIRALGTALLPIMLTEAPAFFNDFTTHDASDGLGKVAVTTHPKV